VGFTWQTKLQNMYTVTWQRFLRINTHILMSLRV